MRKMHRVLGLAAAILTAAALSAATIPNGTRISVRNTTSLNSGTAKVGQGVLVVIDGGGNAVEIGLKHRNGIGLERIHVAADSLIVGLLGRGFQGAARLFGNFVAALAGLRPRWKTGGEQRCCNNFESKMPHKCATPVSPKMLSGALQMHAHERCMCM